MIKILLSKKLGELRLTQADLARATRGSCESGTSGSYM